MSELLCPELCDTCPLRTRDGRSPDIIVEIGYEVPGHIENTPHGSSASFELHNGVPTNYDERTSTIGLIDQETGIGVRFSTQGRHLDNGTVQKNIRDCEGPVEERGGFLWLRKQLACSAIKNLEG